MKSGSRPVGVISLDEAVGLLKEDLREPILLFLGAGISADPPARCPTWKELLKRSMLSALRAHPGLDQYYRLVEPHLTGFKPELLCQVLYENLMEDFFGFLDIMYMGQPNHNHRHIAAICRQRAVPVVFTTNFDIHLETALSCTDANYTLSVSSLPRSLQKSLEKIAPGNKTHLVKIHGSLDDRASIILTLRQAGRKLKRDLSDAISTALQSYTVLVVGYSGNDDDIFPVFLESSDHAKRVFWVLWGDERSIHNGEEHNAELFARACPNCILVAAKHESIFDMLTASRADQSQKNESSRTEARDREIEQEEFLLRWASGTKSACWKNSFSELLLSVECSVDVAKMIVRDSATTIRTESDKWVISKALTLQARALITLKDYEEALAAISKGADTYQAMGHHKEVIECLTLMVVEIPLEAKWRGDDPLSWSAQLSAKTYDPYSMGLYNYSAGIYFLRKQRFDVARTYLLTAAGYLKRCGDTMMLAKAMEGLEGLARLRGESDRERACHREVARLRGVLGIGPASRVAEEGPIIKECEEAARKDTRKTIEGEGLIVLANAVVLGAIASFFVHSWTGRIWTFLSIFAAGAAVKLWNAAKMFVKYTHIERS